MENKMIKVRKLSTGIVSYRIPGQMVARRWRGRNAVQLVPYAELQQCIYDPDIKTLFDYGYLYIEDEEARIEFGYEIKKNENGEENVEEQQFLVLDRTQIVKMLYGSQTTIEAFENTIKKMAPETAELLIEIATESDKHAGYDKYDLIKKYFNVDVETVKKNRREDSK